MRMNKIGAIAISILAVISIICITCKCMSIEFIRDVLIVPILVISLYLMFKK